MDLATKGEQPFANLVREQFVCQPLSAKIEEEHPNGGRKALLFSEAGRKQPGSHVLSGAVVVPRPLRALFRGRLTMADLPIVPDRFKLVVRDERSRKQMTVITRLLPRKDVDQIINACDAGREGDPADGVGG